MSYSWTQFFIAISVLIVLYYAVIYVMFFLRKKQSHNSTTGEINNSAVEKNMKKNNMQTHMHLAAVATTLIDTKIIKDDYFEAEDDFVINESINQNYVDENGVLQNNTTSIANNGNANEAILNEADKINLLQTIDNINSPHNDDSIGLSEITISENFIKEDITAYNEPYPSIIQKAELVQTTKASETKLNFVEDNISIAGANEIASITNSLPLENKINVANHVGEDKYFTPTIKPQQMQSLLHLVQKK
jgi:hypothetical protein